MDRAFQVGGEVGGGQVPLGHRPRQAAQADSLQLRLDAGVVHPKRPGIAVEDLLKNLVLVAARKRQLAGQSSVQDNTDRPDVSAAVETVGLPSHLLRRHVGECPRDFDLPLLLDLLVDGQAEVADMRLILEVEKNVRRLEVTVDDAACVDVNVVHGVGD